MNNSRFVYVIYIRTTAEKLWAALITPEFNKQWWFGSWQESEWKAGAAWKLHGKDKLTDSGEVLEIDPPKRLVLKWRNEFMPEVKAEGYSRATFELEPAGALIKLTVVHEIDKPASILISKVSGGWPMILSNLKSLLETGKHFDRPGA